MREFASADVKFVEPWLSESMEIFTTITWNGPSRGAGEREIFKSFRKNTFFSLVCMNVLHHVVKKPYAPWVSWSLDARRLPMISLISLLWSKCLPSPTTLSNNLPNSSELNCEQDHEYFLNRLLFATWQSCGLFPFGLVSELFSLSSPGSSRQFSFEHLQLHPICPYIIHGETGMNQNISWMNTILPRLLRVRFSLSVDFRSQQDFNMTFHPSKNAVVILLKTLLLELSRQLGYSFHITNCWRSCLWSTSGKLAAPLKMSPAL